MPGRRAVIVCMWLVAAGIPECEVSDGVTETLQHAGTHIPSLTG